ncbi:hypothetical protein OH77DRAFT_1489248 [Trametes cingulata]|nr:hypothetical protein OH77DRAFT_1489248 [Trametes cingulata]
MPPRKRSPRKLHIERISGWRTGPTAYLRSLTEAPRSPDSDSEDTPPRTRRLRERGSGSGAWNTAVPLTETSGQTFGFDPKDADSRNARLGEEIRWTVVGPMPVEVFLEEFFQASCIDFTEMPPPEGAFNGVVTENTKNEKDMYAPLIQALNAVDCEKEKRGSRCPGFTFRNTSAHPDVSGGTLGAKKPDICCYADEHLPTVDANKGDLQSRTDMGLAASFFEVKLRDSDDLFYDPPSDDDDVDRKTWPFVLGRFTTATLPIAQVELGQNTTYAAEIGMRQFRHCVYSVFLSGVLARLARWDRAGVIVTQAFDLRRRPELLCRFFWCFSKVSHTERGYDLNVQPATWDDEKLFKRLIAQHVREQLPSASTEERIQLFTRHYARNCVTSVCMPRMEGDTEVSYKLLISRPITVPLSVVGRSTRAYWAVDVRNKKVVFLKDTWRHREVRIREGLAIEELRKTCPDYIPPVEYHGDVPMVKLEKDRRGTVVRTLHGRPQMTWTQKYLEEPWVCGNVPHLRERVVLRTRYFLVLRYAGCPLTDCRSTSELLHGARGAFEALRRAYVDHKLLHRDITPGNIILYRNESLAATAPRRGYLVDWELACRVEDLADHKRTSYEASMTWQFLSHALATGALNHTIQDDMESLYYSVLYCSLLYLPHSLSPNALLEILNYIFDWSRPSNYGLKSGGTGKRADLTDGIYTENVPWGCPAMPQWLSTVRRATMAFVNAGRPENYSDLWSPDAFATFWDAFLATPPGSELPLDDRQDHVQSNRGTFSKTAPHEALGRPNQATTTVSTATPGLLRHRTPAHPAGQVTSLPSATESLFWDNDLSSGMSVGSWAVAPINGVNPMALIRQRPPGGSSHTQGKRKTEGRPVTRSMKRVKHVDGHVDGAPDSGSRSTRTQDLAESSQSAGRKTQTTGEASNSRGRRSTRRSATVETKKKSKRRSGG